MSLHGILTAIFAGFLIIAALIAGAAATTLSARGTPPSGIWDSKEPSYHELLRHRLVFETGFTSTRGRVVLRRGRRDRRQAAGMGPQHRHHRGQFASRLAQVAAASDLAGSRVIAW